MALARARGHSGRTDRVRQGKTGKELGLLITPQLSDTIAAMPPMVEGQTSYLITDFGKAVFKNQLRQQVREWCDEAGLPQCNGARLA